jgi:hypothetical protein
VVFYEKAGFVVYREVVTRFRTAPRMRLDTTALGVFARPWGAGYRLANQAVTGENRSCATSVA